jgi:hypothetical protein
MLGNVETEEVREVHEEMKVDEESARLSQEDIIMLYVLQTSLGRFSAGSLARKDIIIKGIFRMFKDFYWYKIQQVRGRKN